MQRAWGEPAELGSVPLPTEGSRHCLEPVTVTRDRWPSCIQIFCFQENLEISTFMSTLLIFKCQ